MPPRLTLAFVFDSGFGTHVADRIRTDLRELGIEVTLLGMSPSQFAVGARRL